MSQTVKYVGLRHNSGLPWSEGVCEFLLARDPELDLTMYRVPANPDSFVDDVDNSNSEGFFNPPIRKIERKSDLPSKEECDQFLFSAMSKWFLETISDEKIDLVHPFDVLASR